jgi:hypothetical protein
MGNLSRNDGALTKQEAYQKIKIKLGLSNKVMIFKDVFNLFYYKTGDLYLPKMSESQMDQFFLEHKIRSVNQRIFAVKQRFPKIGEKMYRTAVCDLKYEFAKRMKQASC